MGKGARRARKKMRKEAREKAQKKERKPHYFFLESVEKTVAKRIDDALHKWQLELDKDTTGKVAQAGNRILADLTKDAFKNILGQLKRFLTLIGDYESLLILSDQPPTGCISMSAESVWSFLHYKYDPKDTPLVDSQNRPVKAKCGPKDTPLIDAPEKEVAEKPLAEKPLMCSGAWKSPKKINQLNSAVNLLHLAMGQIGQYKDSCPNCLALPAEDQHKGCRTHSGNARLLRQGNPIDSGLFDDEKQNFKTHFKNYKPRGCSHLLPSYVRKMRDALLSSNGLVDFQTYCIILIGIKVFLRQDEFGDIEIEDFEPTLFIVKDEAIIGLVVKVQGMADDEVVRLYVWLDDENPEFCPVRHLLVYVYLAGIKGGFLFPSKRELLVNRPENGIFETGITADAVQIRVEYLVKIVCKLEGFKCGLQMFRKAAFLFARWGGGDSLDVETDARHTKNSKDGALYNLDANTLNEIRKAHPEDDNNVSTYKSIRLQHISLAVDLNVHSQGRTASIPELATRFVHEHLGVSQDDPKRMYPKYLIEKAMVWKGRVTTAGEFDETLRHLSTEKAASIKSYVDTLSKELAEARSNASNQQGSSSNPVPTNGESVASAAGKSEASEKKRKRGGDIDLSKYQDPIKKAKTTEGKIEAIKVLLENAPSEDESLTNGSKCFVRRVRPIMTCFKEHFKSNVAEFTKAHPKVIHSKFQCACMNE
jgi:hypothetical protein